MSLFICIRNQANKKRGGQYLTFMVLKKKIVHKPLFDLPKRGGAKQKGLYFSAYFFFYSLLLTIMATDNENKSIKAWVPLEANPEVSWLITMKN